MYSAVQQAGSPPEGTSDESFQPGEMESGISGFGGGPEVQAFIRHPPSKIAANSKLVCRLQITSVSVTASSTTNGQVQSFQAEVDRTAADEGGRAVHCVSGTRDDPDDGPAV